MKNKQQGEWPSTRDEVRELGFGCVMWNDLIGTPIVIREPKTGKEITREIWEGQG